MHAFLITGGAKEKRSGWIKEKMEEMHIPPFQAMKLTSETPHIGVESVRMFTKQLMLKPPTGSRLAGIIEDAHQLTTEAQNALLKTLEEPLPQSILILETINAELLLPTVISRCQIISLGALEQFTKDDLFQCINTLEHIQKMKIGERMKIIDAIAVDREQAKAWVEKATAANRAILLEQHSISSAQCIRRLIKAQQQLYANCNPKLALDAVFFPRDSNS